MLLSHHTIARRVSDRNYHVSSKLKTVVEKYKYFSLTSDDSTDISQLLIFIETIVEDFSVHKDFLELISLECSTKGVCIYKALVFTVRKYGDFQKYFCIITEDATAMTSSKGGLVGLLRQNGVVCHTINCIICQEALCGKSDVLGSITQLVNIIH